MEAEASCLLAPPAQLNCRLLLVEDDREHQSLLALMLRKAGAKVTVAENGEIAVELARTACSAEKPFDIVVMDLQMPVLDGVAATREIRANGFKNPIIALTARAIPTDREQCIAAGCDGFLSKPVTRVDLVRFLSTHLKRSRATRHPSENAPHLQAGDLLAG